MENNPLVSIIIPNYNREELLKETLDSVIDQTYHNWEVIVIDDDSTDHSIEVLQAYSQKDERIHFYRRESDIKGACVCRNEGFKKSKGEFILFLDSDDLLSPFCLEGRMKATSYYPDCDFWVFSTLEFNRISGDSDILVNIFTTENPLNRFLRMDVIWLATGPFWKRDTINKIGGWDEKLKSGQDWDFTVRALANGFKFLYFNNIDNYWRRNSNNKISDDNTSKEHLELRIYLFLKIFEFLKAKNQLSEERRRLIRNLFIAYMIDMIQIKNYELLKVAIVRDKELFPEKRKVRMLTYIFTKLYKIGVGRNRIPGLIRYINACEMRDNTFRKVRYKILK